MSTRQYVKHVFQRSRQKGRTLLRPFYIDFGGDHNKSVLIAGTERSGTTWLADLINYKRNHRLMFEPFWKHQVPECHSLRPQQYLRPNAEAPEIHAVVERILRGRIRNAWIDQFHRTFLTSRRIIKDVRINLMLGWIKYHFPDIPIILIIRHPCAVVNSQIKGGHHFGSLRETLFRQQDLVEDHLQGILDRVKWNEGSFSDRIVRWSIQNYIPLKQLRPGLDLHVIFYEDLCTNAELEIRRLFEFLGWPYSPRVMQSLQVPSPVSRSDSAVRAGGHLLHKWTNEISASQASEAIQILEKFGLHQLYSTQPLPQPGAHDAIKNWNTLT